MSLAGQPLIFRDEVLGVLAVFSRRKFSQEGLGWLCTFADHAATALAHAWAFAEVQELRRQLELERDYLRDEIKVVKAFGHIVGQSPAILAVKREVDTVAPTDATVLIEGESGTGKGLIAAALHEGSPRATRLLVRVNCASVPRELFESDFFGHLEGAFTGATRDRAGRFQVADRGTLFLDEVGEIPLELQGNLFRALQEGQFSRVGEDVERSVDVRVVAATNRALLQEVRAGGFREDLYYRLTVFPIRVPAQTAPPKEAAREATERLLTDEEMRRFERRNIAALLERFGWKVAGAGGAAEFPGLHPATLASRMKSMRIERSNSTRDP